MLTSQVFVFCFLKLQLVKLQSNPHGNISTAAEALRKGGRDAFVPWRPEDRRSCVVLLIMIIILVIVVVTMIVVVIMIELDGPASNNSNTNMCRTINNTVVVMVMIMVIVLIMMIGASKTDGRGHAARPHPPVVIISNCTSDGFNVNAY